MLKSRNIEAARSPDCVYAIDGMECGRILSPITSTGLPWNYANGSRIWSDFEAALMAVGTGDFSFEVDANLIDGSGTVFGNGSIARFGFSGNPANLASYGYTFGFNRLLSGFTVAGNDPAIFWRHADTVVYTKGEYRKGGRSRFKMVRTGGVLTLYLDDVLFATATGTPIAYVDATKIVSNFNGQIYSATLRNGLGVAVWSYGNWESQNGLLTPENIKTLNGKFEVAATGFPATITTPVDLRGRTTGFTLIWHGSLKDCPTISPVFQQGATVSGALSLTFSPSNLQLQANICGATGAIVNVSPSENVSLAMVVDPGASYKIYVEGELKATVPLSASLSFSTQNLQFYPVSGCNFFAMFDRALSAEEVAAI